MFNTLGNRKENTENFILIGVWQPCTWYGLQS